ncbi:MAG: glycosyltransferase [Inconstantimicrobium porci]|uniref:glycosyltransferase family 2 protein n=1 Tax=Inconstantimicrobium porci TaxID=2652291 RepID=UPI002A90BB2F|nr:glycosyltransferase [Inconstantimicrobium porci]MDY5912885.1 glycosyltransferase [Inconstantimicrobium porci]
MENNINLISVIIPVYKENDEYLSKCIQSVVEQTYCNLEIIIVNDGMSESNKDTIKKFTDIYNNIEVIGDKNEGVSSARNKGIDYCTGKWIVFIDSDDWIEKDYCKIMLEKALETKCDCVICGYNRVYNNQVEKINCDTSNNCAYNGNVFLDKVLNVQNSVGFSHMKLIKAEIIKNNNLRFNKDIVVAEDALFFIEMSQFINKVCTINIPLYNYRFNSNSVVRKYDELYADKYLKAMKVAKKYIMNKYTSNEKVLQSYYNYVVYHLMLIMINYCYNFKNEKSGYNKMKEFAEICNIEEFKESIEKSNYNDLSLSRKVALWAIKHKLYVITKIIGDIRQYQFSKN